METLLALEMVRVTEAAAIASARLMGRGDKMDADRLAVEAMRSTLDEIPIDGTGSSSARASATRRPMLYIGERVGDPASAVGEAPEIDIAVDPLEGTNLVANGQAGSITVLAATERGGLLHAPDCYMDKLCVGPVVAGKVDITAPPAENLRRIAAALAPRRRRHHRRDPGAPAPRGAHRGGARRPARGSSSSATATSRRRSRARCPAPASMPSWGSAARPRA